MKTPRYLISFDTGKLPLVQTDILVIGGGIAGLRAAIEASQSDAVLVITKDQVTESNTYYAQGGIAAHLDNHRLVESHIKDTLESGQGLSAPAVVRSIIRRGVKEIKHLIEWGMRFDRRGKHLDLAQEGGHHYPRILHAGGDNTGKEIVRNLIQQVRQHSNIEIQERVFAIDLLTGHYAPTLLAYQTAKQKICLIQARVIIIASGGLGQLYRETTNPLVATGDGIALAYRAGAVLQDMEFIQFHPTALYVAGASRALISEAVRGAGGILVDKFGKRFMPDYHPLGELAPRDIVSRSIINQMRLTGDTSVYLDVTHLGVARIKNRFPGLYHLCQTFGIDISRDLIPVRPSAHYLIGGIKISLDGSTNLPNIFAAGECAASSFHGANRLGSNSLLEGLVLGVVCGRTAGRKLRTKAVIPSVTSIRHTRRKDHTDLIDVIDVRNSLKSLMWRAAGIERENKHLSEALHYIDFWGKYILDKEFDNPAGWELQNMIILAHLVTIAALRRTESRGAHYRTDSPQPDNKHWKKHITLQKS